MVPVTVNELREKNWDVFFDVIRFLKDGVITEDDLTDFSDDFKDAVAELKKRFM